MKFSFEESENIDQVFSLLKFTDLLQITDLQQAKEKNDTRQEECLKTNNSRFVFTLEQKITLQISCIRQIEYF